MSAIGMASGLIVLGVYMLLKSRNYDMDPFKWISLASFSVIIFFSTFGISTLYSLVIAEIMPLRVKEIGISFCAMLLSIFAFILVKCFPFLVDLIGLHGCVFLFAGVCLSCTLFIIFFMPETKNRTYAEIMKAL